MLDYLKRKIKRNRDGGYEVSCEFVLSGKVEDLMVRGGAFYAVWDEARGLWSRNEYDAARFYDEEVWRAVEDLRVKKGTDATIVPKLMSDFSTQKAVEWKRYLKASPDRFHELDTTVTFADENICKLRFIELTQRFFDFISGFPVRHDKN